MPYQSHVLASALFYLDPGSGSFLLQLLIAGVVGVAFAVRIYWKKLKTLFIKEKTEELLTLENNDRK